MTCKCVCTCPPEVGDEIRYKLNPDSVYPDVRVNGALKLTLAYLGTEYAVYKWVAPRRGADSKDVEGESMLTREEFDEKIERVPANES